MENLNQFKSDLDELRTKRSHIQVKLEESMSRAADIKESLKKQGFASLAEAKEEYKRRVSDAGTKHKRVLQLINQIKETEASIPTKEDILAKLREEAANTNMTLNVSTPPLSTGGSITNDININL